MSKIVKKLTQCWKGTSMNNADAITIAKTMLEAVTIIRKELDEILARLKALEERKPETQIHNYYHNETPTYWPPVRYGTGTGDPIPPNVVTCGVGNGS